MKLILKINIFLLLFYLTAISVYSYENTITRLTLTTRNGYSTDKLMFGIAEKATDSRDEELGEFEAPPFAPPQGEGINAGFVIYDTTQEAYIWVYKDYRPYPKTDTAIVRHKIQILKGTGDIVTITWNQLWPEIESAILFDNITGNLVRINMKDSIKATIQNQFIDVLLLEIKYKANVSVRDDNQLAVKVYPTEFNNEISINPGTNSINFALYDIMGIKYFSGNCSETKLIDSRFLHNGIYIMKLFDNNGNSAVIKLIKLDKR